MKNLYEYAKFSDDKISIKESIGIYVGVDNMNSNKRGIIEASYIPSSGNFTKFKTGDILVGNIRPYLKKIWLSDCEGVASPDVLVVSPSNRKNSRFIYSALLDDRFFDYMMAGSKGSKMPRGDREHVMKYVIPNLKNMTNIGEFIYSLGKIIELNNAINDNLEQQAKLLYDYWFTQFDFPDENGKPYRTSGGKMVWNEQLKRDIPEGWEVKSLAEILKKNTDVFDYQSIQPAVDLSIMPSNSIAISQLNSSNSFTTNLFTMKKGDILFGSIRPYLHKAGFAPCDGVVAGTVHSFRLKNSQDNNFALMTVSRDNFFNYAVNVSSGTKMPVVSSDSILDYKVPYNNKIARRYNEMPLIAIISSHIQENQKLISLRDWLLPMLMNGQANIED